MAEVTLDDLIESQFKAEENGSCSGVYALKAQYPLLGVAMHQPPMRKTGKASFQVSVGWAGDAFLICLSWRLRGKVAFFHLTDISELWREIEDRMREKRLDWRDSKF